MKNLKFDSNAVESAAEEYVVQRFSYEFLELAPIQQLEEIARKERLRKYEMKTASTSTTVDEHTVRIEADES